METPVWKRVARFTAVIFLTRLADAVISFWVPNLLQTTYGSSITTGILISLQSVFGVGLDLVFPSLLRKEKTNTLLIWAVFASGLTAFFLYFASLQPIIILFLIALFTWSLYYELESFAASQFVATKFIRTERSAAWGIIEVFKNLAY